MCAHVQMYINIHMHSSKGPLFQYHMISYSKKYFIDCNHLILSYVHMCLVNPLSKGIGYCAIWSLVLDIWVWMARASFCVKFSLAAVVDTSVQCCCWCILAICICYSLDVFRYLNFGVNMVSYVSSSPIVSLKRSELEDQSGIVAI